MSSPLTIVMLNVAVPSRISGFEEGVRALVDAGHTVHVVGLRKLDADDWPVEETVWLGPAVLPKGKGPLGRARVRVWPGSVARQLDRAARRSRETQRLLDSADLVVAVDRASVPTLWRSSRRRRDVPHIFGIASAVTIYRDPSLLER